MKSQRTLSIEDLKIGDFVECRFYCLYDTLGHLNYKDSNKSFNAVFVGTKMNAAYPIWNRYYFYVYIKGRLKLHYTFDEYIKEPILLLC